MKFTEEEINNFIDAWENDWGERLTEEEARIQLMQLVAFYRVLARRLPNNETGTPSENVPS